ncbi:hypothetical protein BDN72DRAFT_846640 [Pluteus cervinus]|uniref:Uncharacterized protein n=1 Tax=Pluteus cervinus TaxID=181527 RepID=A0ACD3AEQ7_9AGAR|nr:hypothetical protein BDN72DRAFT_846640 [Pluteus cervinus]
MLDYPQPVFPPEIEEIIFSLSAQSSVDQNRNLILVAKRVYQWLLPQLYKVAILNHGIPPARPKYSRQLLDKHGQHVRHLLYWDPESFDAPDICISLCPNVVDLALWGLTVRNDSGTLIHQILAIRQRLTRLSFDVDLFHSGVTKLPDSTLVSFISVTHLELIGSEIALKPEKIKEYFPSVTHLAVNGARTFFADGILDCWKDQLKVLILYLEIDQDYVANDPRIAVMLQDYEFVHHWNEATKDGQSNVWRRAEEAVEVNRQSGS